MKPHWKKVIIGLVAGVSFVACCALALAEEHFVAVTDGFVQWGSEVSPLILKDYSGKEIKKITGQGLWPKISPDGKKIAYFGADGLYVVDIDDPQNVILTEPLMGAFVNWSPDGTKLIYDTGFGAFLSQSAADISVLDIDTAQSKTILQADSDEVGDGPAYVFAVYSPDGKKIAFCSDKIDYVDRVLSPSNPSKTNFEIFCADINADDELSNVTQLTFNDKQGYFKLNDLMGYPLATDILPAFSPDGREIAFVSFMTGNPEIWKIDIETKKETQLTSGQAQKWFPRWSSDGRIAYISKPQGEDVQFNFFSYDDSNKLPWVDGDRTIRIMNSDGTNDTFLMDIDDNYMAYFDIR